jgi:hypothetical protein
MKREERGGFCNAPYAGMTRIRFQGTLSLDESRPLRLNGKYSQCGDASAA